MERQPLIYKELRLACQGNFAVWRRRGNGGHLYWTSHLGLDAIYARNLSDWQTVCRMGKAPL